MASSVPAKKNTAFSFPISFEAVAGGSFLTAPALEAGDVQISKLASGTWGAWANVTTLPTQLDSSDVFVVTATATEMDADGVQWRFRDGTSPDAWLPMNAGPVFTAAQTLDEMDTNIDSILVDTAEIGAAGAGLTNINLPDQTMNITGNITGNLSGSVGSVTGLTASDVGAIKAKTDNLPSDPADASVIAGRFDTLDTSVADLPTNAELTTALGTADDAVLAQVALVKAKTDSLTFTVAGQVDANIQSVNDVTVNGVGTAGNPWGP